MCVLFYLVYLSWDDVPSSITCVGYILVLVLSPLTSVDSIKLSLDYTCKSWYNAFLYHAR